MWPVVVAVIVIPSAHQNHPALGLNLLFVRPIGNSWEGEVEWDVDRGPHGSSAPAWHLPQLPQSSQGCFLGTYRDNTSDPQVYSLLLIFGVKIWNKGFI